MKNRILLDFLTDMMRIRLVEEELARKYEEQEMRCPMHLCIGQEAIAVGVAKSMIKSDFMFSNHRAHGHYLSKGGDLLRMVAELYGREIGCCGGRGGSMHVIDTSVGFLGATPIVGGTVPVAVGSAWASKIFNEKKITTVFFGDGCFEEGVIHESLNFAALHKLPIIFVCENNNFSVYTKLKHRQPPRSIHKVAESHGINTFYGDGNDVLEVFRISKEAIKYSRGGRGPCFLEFSTYRWREHCGPFYDDDLGYRSENEIKSGKNSCPIIKLKKELISKSILKDEDILKIENSIKLEINNIFNEVLKSNSPSIHDAKKFQYA